jgi:hypothetical protein
MATHAHSTTTRPVQDAPDRFDIIADIRFDAQDRIFADLPTAADSKHVRVALQIATTMLQRSKGELIDVVTALQGKRPAQDQLTPMIDQLEDVETFLGVMRGNVQEALARLYIASVAAVR